MNFDYQIFIDKIESFIILAERSDFWKLIEYGWGNGYVAIHKSNPFFGYKYTDIIDTYRGSINIRDLFIVHGGITFSDSLKSIISEDIDIINKDDYWVFGFDTNHNGDNILNCYRGYVLSESYKLKHQLDDGSIIYGKEWKKKLRSRKLRKINGIENG